MQAGAHAAPLAARAPARVLACGAYLKNRACLIDAGRVLWSPLHGDLAGADACRALERSVDALVAQASGPVQAVAHDLHPDFFSTRLAQALGDRWQVPAFGVQHHHAHIGVALAEPHDAPWPGGPVIGVALDGMGMGDDGQAWGGEILWLDGVVAAHRWQRLDHLLPLALPGGDVAAREPWRMAAAALHASGRGAEIEARFAPAVGLASARGVRSLLERDLCCPRSSSAGRWFDAAAGALAVSVRQTVEAEAAMALQVRASACLQAHPGLDLPDPGLAALDLRPLLAVLFALAEQGPEARAHGAAWFHLALAGGLAQRATEAARTHGAATVVLAGGCLVNPVLRERLEHALRRAGIGVRQPQGAGCGDAGLALGQAWIAACALQDGGDTRCHARVARGWASTCIPVESVRAVRSLVASGSPDSPDALSVSGLSGSSGSWDSSDSSDSSALDASGSVHRSAVSAADTVDTTAPTDLLAGMNPVAATDARPGAHANRAVRTPREAAACAAGS